MRFSFPQIWECTLGWTYVNDVFALVAFLIVGARACRQLSDVDAVDIAGGASNVDCLLGSFSSSPSCAINDEHPLHSLEESKVT